MDRITAAMPELAHEFAALIGVDATLEFCEAVGGTDVGIPKPDAVHAGHRLAPLLGLENLQRLAEHFGGGRYYIPRCAALIARRREQQIMQRLDSGQHVAAVAREFQCTERNVYLIRRRWRDAEQSRAPSSAGAATAESR